MYRVVPFLCILAGCVAAPPSLEQLVEELQPGHEAERECLLSACRQAEDPQALAACRIERCAYEPESWVLKPTAIRHEGETFFVEASLAYSAGKYGSIPAPRPREAYVGVTVVPSQGDEIDLAVTTVFADKLDEPFTLSTDIVSDVRDVIFGVWDRKIEPCESERSGCREFGFLLDGPLATWPPTIYVDGTRQRLPPSELSVLVLDAGAGPDLPERREVVLKALTDKLRIFGSVVGQVETRRASKAIPGSQIAVADDHDLLLAKRAAAGLDHEMAALVDSEASTAVVIKLGGNAFEQVESCGELVNDEYDTCVTELR